MGAEERDGSLRFFEPADILKHFRKRPRIFGIVSEEETQAISSAQLNHRSACPVRFQPRGRPLAVVVMSKYSICLKEEGLANWSLPVMLQKVTPLGAALAKYSFRS
jgi:hypothetical protein